MLKYSEQRLQQKAVKSLPTESGNSKPDMADVPLVNEANGIFDQKLKVIQEIDRYDSCEEVDSDDMAGDLCDSDSDEGEERRANFKALRGAKRESTKQEAPGQKYNQEFDTNVFEVKLDCLENKGEVATGDAQICTSCSGVFSSISKLTTEGQTQIWICEFCNHKNEVNIDDEEIPKSSQVTYLIEAAPPKKEIGKDDAKV